MKKSKLLPVILIVLFSSCAMESTRTLRLELPPRTQIRVEAYDGLVILGFLETEPSPDFDAREELAEYLAYELGLRLPDKVSRKDAVPESVEAFDDPAVWKAAGAAAERALLLTGVVKFTREARKALSLDDREIDGPFKSERSAFTQRTLFTLTGTLYFIEASSGTVVFRREIKESKAYESVRHPAAFAFSELALRMRTKLFAAIFGEGRFQERTLILRD